MVAVSRRLLFILVVCLLVVAFLVVVAGCVCCLLLVTCGLLCVFLLVVVLSLDVRGVLFVFVCCLRMRFLSVVV